MIAVVGSLNLDFTVEVSRFPQPGETITGRRLRRAPGGKGANQAVAVARMGAPVALIGAVGDDPFGQEMLTGLASSGVDIARVLQRREVASGSAWITIDDAGQNQIVVAPGANATLTPEEILRSLASLSGVRALLLQMEIPLPVVFAAIEWARKENVPIFLNLAPFVPMEEVWLRSCAWVIVNEAEAAQLTGCVVNSATTAGAAAAVLRTRLPETRLAFTLGADGAWIEAPEFSGHVLGFPAEAVDTVGAGDTWIGAFVSQWITGEPLLHTIRFAHLAAALAVSRPGAQASIPTRAEVEADSRRQACGSLG